MRMLKTSILLSGTLLVVGCNNISGQWEATEAAGDFQLARATFNADKTYEATGEYQGRTQTSTGKYTYGGMNLILMPDSGRPQRTYGARLSVNGKQLIIKSKEKGQDPKIVTMKRVGCPKDCGKKCCKSTAAGCSKDCGKDCKMKCAKKQA